MMNKELEITLKKLGIVIPVYNEGKRLDDFLLTLAKALETHFAGNQVKVVVVCVDDGSREPVKVTHHKFPNFVSVHLLRHKVNFGQGAALQTGIEYARDNQDCDWFVTMDSDGQHSADDLPKILHGLKNDEADIVFGTRFAETSKTNVPISRKILLKSAIMFENLVSGVKSSDAHNGFRAFNKKYASVVNLKQNKMAHATEFKLIVAKYKFRYTEQPVQIIYSEESLAKGQRGTGAFLIIRDLLRMLIFDRG